MMIRHQSLILRAISSSRPVLLGRHIHSLTSRGLIQQVFPPLDEKGLSELLKSSRTAYCGFDPTSDSLHVGNLLSIIVLLHLQKKGVAPIAVVGDATVQIGDPSGRLTERDAINQGTIENNCAAIENNLRTVFGNFSRYFYKGPPLPEVNLQRNSTWYRGQDVVEFLGTFGRRFRLSKMLQRESVKQRLASSEGMSVAEFSYQMFQAYDWLQLYEKFQCNIQIGGQDQLGNIDSGHDLIRRIHRHDAYGLMTPIITAESGDKFGKSAGSAVWLSPSKTSSYDFYQYFLRTSDAEALKFVKLFTFMEDEELEELFKEQKSKPEERPCQKRIATDLTLLVHGQEGVDLAVKATEILFNGRAEHLRDLNAAELKIIFGQSAYAEIPRKSNIGIVEFSMAAGLFPTEYDAKRIISAGGLYLNMERAKEDLDVNKFVLPSGITLARVGKKNYTLVKWK